MSHSSNVLWIVVERQGRIVVHLHAPFPRHFLVAALAAVGALAAAAAASAAEAEHGGDQGVPGRQRVQRPRQEVPAAQHPGQVARPAGLHHVDHDHKDDQHHDGHAHAHHGDPAGHGQAEHGQGDDQEAQDEIEDGEPAVFGRAVPQPPSEPYRYSHEGDWVPDDDTHDIEEEMAESNLRGKHARVIRCPSEEHDRESPGGILRMSAFIQVYTVVSHQILPAFLLNAYK